MPPVSPLDRLRWCAAVAKADLPLQANRLAPVLAMAATQGTCWLSKPTIAKELGCSATSLVTAFQALEGAGFVRRGLMRGPDGRRTQEWHLEYGPGPKNGPGPESEADRVRNPDTDRVRNPDPKGGIEREEREGGSATPSPPMILSQDEIRKRIRRILRAIPLPNDDKAVDEWVDLLRDGVKCKSARDAVEAIDTFMQWAKDAKRTVRYARDVPPDDVSEFRELLTKGPEKTA